MGDHQFIRGRSFLTDDVTAGCTCGWEVDASDEADAIDEWENHVVSMEATEASTHDA